jgi:hypothetical protein
MCQVGYRQLGKHSSLEEPAIILYNSLLMKGEDFRNRLSIFQGEIHLRPSGGFRLVTTTAVIILPSSAASDFLLLAVLRLGVGG